MRKKISSARVWRWLFSLPLMAGLLFGALPSKAPAAVTGQVRISLSSSAPAPGSTVTATVTFSASSPIIGVNTKISIPTSIVESFEVVNGNGTTSEKNGPAEVQLIYMGNDSTSGTLATIRMKIRSDAPAGGAGSLQVIMAEGSGIDPATGKLVEKPIQMNRGSAGMTVTVPKSSNANLSSLKVNGQEVSGTGYKITVPYGTSSATISATPQDSKARVSGTGTKSLSVGTNKFTVTVTAENGASKGYTVTVVREAQQNTATSAQPKPNTSSSRPSPVSSGRRRYPPEKYPRGMLQKIARKILLTVHQSFLPRWIQILPMRRTAKAVSSLLVIRRCMSFILPEWFSAWPVAPCLDILSEVNRMENRIEWC